MSHIANMENCTGCKLCEYICPNSAIHFEDNNMGFSMPVVDKAKCIHCNKCQRMCPACEPVEKSKPTNVYAAVSLKENTLMTSASGGVFAELAEIVLEEDGVVYGASMETDADCVLRIVHEGIRTKDQIVSLQRSKYVQSDMRDVYKSIREDLSEKKKVLFSGTPCQAAAIRRAFGNNELLLVVDIICHGVPSQKMFSDYLKVITKTKKVNISNFYFRTKESGWGLCAQLLTENKDGKTKSERIPCTISSYYHMFLHGAIYRECCYSCGYATQERVGDITIGDFWGIHKFSDLYAMCRDKGMDITKGISCVLVNSERGMQWLHKAKLALVDSDFESVAKENHQLYEPSKRSNERDLLLESYRTGGYEKIERDFNKKLGVKKYLIIAKNKMPAKLRMRIRMLLGK